MGTSNEAIRPIPNSYWVIRGRFAAGEYPGAIDPRAAADKVRAVLEAGIDCFFDLTEEGELVPYRSIAEEEARRLGRDIEWTRHPIVDTRVPRSPGEMAGILDAIDSALGRGRNVYVHCWGGVGRTGTVVGCWLVRHGRTGDGTPWPSSGSCGRELRRSATSPFRLRRGSSASTCANGRSRPGRS